MTQSASLTPADTRDPSVRDVRSRVRSIYRHVPGPLLGLIVVVVALSLSSPYFLTARNVVNVLSQISDIGIMAAGSALVIITGGIDLSVGAVLATSVMVNAWLYTAVGVPFPLAVLAGLAFGTLVGAINGALSTYGRIQPFVATLATMSACSGFALFITDGHPITGFPDWYGAITSIRLFGIPFEAVILGVIFLIAAFWLRFRPSGRALYAVGGNEEVARLSGLNVRLIRVSVYAVAGLLAAVAGIVVESRLDSAQPTAGVNDLLSVIAVVVIGGASLAGGSGSMLGTFIGLLTIGVLRNGMDLLNVSPNLQPVVIGAAIIFAVMTDRRTRY